MRCGLCRKLTFRKRSTLQMMTAEGLHKIKICSSCSSTLEAMKLDVIKSVTSAKKDLENDGEL